jgi:hypothetical protein
MQPEQARNPEMEDGFIDGSQATRAVFISGRRLDPRRSQKLWNHSPDGFNWGYGGSGPAQLALAILLEMGVDDATAVQWHQDFKFAIVASLEPEFKLPISTVRAWITNQEAEDKAKIDDANREMLGDDADYDLGDIGDK